MKYTEFSIHNTLLHNTSYMLGDSFQRQGVLRRGYKWALCLQLFCFSLISPMTYRPTRRTREQLISWYVTHVPTNGSPAKHRSNVAMTYHPSPRTDQAAVNQSSNGNDALNQLLPNATSCLEKGGASHGSHNSTCRVINVLDRHNMHVCSVVWTA